MAEMTLEEAFAAATVDDGSETVYCTVDDNTRLVTVPEKYKKIGSESDEKAKRVWFRFPKMVGNNGIDLSAVSVRVNFRNANGDGDIYMVQDLTVDGDYVVFSWELSRKVTAYKGNVEFVVCAVKSSTDGTAKNEWNTTLNRECEVLEGLEVREQIAQENPDIIEYILANLGGSVSAEDIATAVEEYMTTHPFEETDPTVPDWAKNPTKPTYTASEVGALPNTTKIPSKTSDLQNDSGFLTQHQDLSGYALKTEVPKSPSDIGAEAEGTADGKVSAHNTAGDAHNDIRELISGLTQRLNALADSDDTALDQMSEVVAYIKSNKNLIDAITTSKINVSDIIDNLTTNVSDKPLSAAQGVALKAMIEEMGSTTEGDVIDVDAELKAYMQTVKPDMVSAIVEKGGVASESDAWGEFPNKVRAIPNGVSPTESLPEQTTLVASILSTGGIGLNWKDTGAAGYLIIRKTGGVPENTADGTSVYNGDWSETVTDTDVAENVTYYYRIFPYNSSNQYQAFEGGSVKSVTYKNRSGEFRIADVEVGDKILFGAWGTTVQSWTVCDTQDKESGFVTVCLDNHAGGNRCFDEIETNNPVSNRASQGNNRWAYSNIRQWLNSDGAASEWFVAQHDYDVRPNYYNNKGWLADFTDYEKGIIIPHKSKCILDQADGGGSETVYDKMFLASSYAMGLEIIKPLEDEHMYELFTDNASRSFSSNFWLRTINGTTSASGVRCVNSGGNLSNGAANFNYAARPFCKLPTSAYIVWSDSDNAYVFADDSQRNG
ncbi:MAG: DUF6273 domain-containing protein [Oliverpabstia sp.]